MRQRRARFPETAPNQVARMLQEAGPGGLLMAELQDPRRRGKTMEIAVYSAKKAGRAFGACASVPGVNSGGRLTRYFGFQEWADAFREAREAAMLAAARGPALTGRQRDPQPDRAPVYIAPEAAASLGPKQGYAPGFVFKPATPFVDRRFAPDPGFVAGRGAISEDWLARRQEGRLA